MDCDICDKYKKLYATESVRADYLGEENQRVKGQNQALRRIERAALMYCEAASEGLPTVKLDNLFTDLVDTLGWRRKAREGEQC